MAAVMPRPTCKPPLPQPLAYEASSGGTQGPDRLPCPLHSVSLGHGTPRGQPRRILRLHYHAACSPMCLKTRTSSFKRYKGVGPAHKESYSGHTNFPAFLQLPYPACLQGPGSGCCVLDTCSETKGQLASQPASTQPRQPQQ
ncbi:hypothetical protein NDU88_011198 [Pleurodeles waltl]|uniref:Uncharacterized protein n=1 Tax=Pleurodeles waltl TaxID=8319 RepID=A0AAV7R0X9_PLEWA|nr:hypothetical protein NDU88_011198 [Pleurodeles waltl]